MIDIGGPAMLRAGGEELRARRAGPAPSATPDVLAELRSTARCRSTRAARSRPRPSSSPPRTSRRSPSGSPTGRRSPRASSRRSGRTATSRTARTRTSARPTTRRPERAGTCSPASSSCTAASSRTTTSTTSRRRGSWPRSSPSGLRDRQAREPLRRRGRRGDRGRLRARPRRRPGLGLRRRDRAQPAGVGRARHALAEHFVEVLFAPGYEDEALDALRKKEAVRILVSTERRNASSGERDYRRVLGGLLAQDRDADVEDREGMIVVCGDPGESDWGDLLFAWRVCKHVTSNAIVIAKDLRTIGIGAGQMSRVDAVRIAVEKARARPRPRGRRACLRRLLPVPRRAAARARRRGDRDHPARRLERRVDASAVQAAGATMVFTGRRPTRSSLVTSGAGTDVTIGRAGFSRVPLAPRARPVLAPDVPLKDLSVSV